MIKNDEMIEVYNDYDSNIYANSVMGGMGLIFPRKDEYDEPYIVSIPYVEIKALHQGNRNIFTKKILRIVDREEEIFKALNINMTREPSSFSREEIEDMLKNPTDYVIQTVLGIKELPVINRFLAQLVYLKNTNRYFIPSKIENYIRARKEELEAGVKESELEGQPTENTALISSEVELGIEEEVKAPSKPKATKTTPKAKK